MAFCPTRLAEKLLLQTLYAPYLHCNRFLPDADFGGDETESISHCRRRRLCGRRRGAGRILPRGPAAPGFAIVIVTHLSPTRESLLHEIIARYTRSHVGSRADDKMEVKLDSVYVLPAGAVMSIDNGRLHVRKTVGRRERKPIDIFFSSLAVDIGELAAGVVLSGGDGDGTLGIKAIKERGGLTLAQVADGFGPQHPDMPDSAISTGLVDFAVPAERDGREAGRVRAQRRIMLDERSSKRRRRPSEDERSGRGAAGDLRYPAQPGRPRLQRLQDQDLPAPRAAAHAGDPARARSTPMSSGCGRTRRRSARCSATC